MKLKTNELKMIYAGSGASTGIIAAAIITGVSFIVGIFDGFIRPFKCR